jgi:predicted 3-demethylubiquinone-9 3-methyltransferase (glyoxalase superfamily)
MQMRGFFLWREKMITPCLWFNMNAQEALGYYLAIFKDSSIAQQLFYGEDAPALKGTLLMATIKLKGLKFALLNAPSPHLFTPATSFVLQCETQDEVDYYWESFLKDGGKAMACSWLTDKYGVAWQIVPKRLLELLHDEDAQKAKRAMQAMMTMIKIDIAAIEAAVLNEGTS